MPGVFVYSLLDYGTWGKYFMFLCSIVIYGLLNINHLNKSFAVEFSLFFFSVVSSRIVIINQVLYSNRFLFLSYTPTYIVCHVVCKTLLISILKTVT